jgi:hypothetical protein
MSLRELSENDDNQFKQGDTGSGPSSKKVGYPNKAEKYKNKFKTY